MIKFASKEEMLRHFNFTPKTANDRKRANICWGWYLSGYRGDGCIGCIAELLMATENSHKMTVANQRKKDDFFSFERADGKIVKLSAECKTSGGRIDNIKGGYVIYSLDVDNKLAKRHVSARIIPADVFLAKLREFNAVKVINKNGVFSGYGIQSSSKSLYQWLLDDCLEYHRDWVYTAEDFE